MHNWGSDCVTKCRCLLHNYLPWNLKRAAVTIGIYMNWRSNKEQTFRETKPRKWPRILVCLFEDVATNTLVFMVQKFSSNLPPPPQKKSKFIQKDTFLWSYWDISKILLIFLFFSVLLHQQARCGNVFTFKNSWLPSVCAPSA